MASKRKEDSLGSVIRKRRGQLELTQVQVAKKVGCRPNYIGYLETGQRRPSQKVLLKIARALDLDPQELFLIAHPQVRDVIFPEVETRESVWEHFKANKRLHTRHGITRDELAALEGLALLGPVRSQRDFLFILQTVRQAMADE